MLLASLFRFWVEKIFFAAENGGGGGGKFGNNLQK